MDELKEENTGPVIDRKHIPTTDSVEQHNESLVEQHNNFTDDLVEQYSESTADPAMLSEPITDPELPAEISEPKTDVEVLSENTTDIAVFISESKTDSANHNAELAADPTVLNEPTTDSIVLINESATDPVSGLTTYDPTEPTTDSTVLINESTATDPATIISDDPAVLSPDPTVFGNESTTDPTLILSESKTGPAIGDNLSAIATVSSVSISPTVVLTEPITSPAVVISAEPITGPVVIADPAIHPAVVRETTVPSANELHLSRATLKEKIFDVPETFTGGLCGKTHPLWFESSCGISFLVIAVVLLVALILGGVSRYDCPAVPELPYSLITFGLFGFAKLAELISKNILVTFMNITCWKKHPQLKYLLILWTIFDILFNLIIVVVFCASLYWTLAALRELFKTDNSSTEMCKGRLVYGSFGSLFIFFISLVLLGATTLFRCCLSRRTNRRQTTSTNYIDEGCTDLTTCYFCLPFCIQDDDCHCGIGDLLDVPCDGRDCKHYDCDICLDCCVKGGNCFFNDSISNGCDCNGCDCNGCDCNGCDCNGCDCNGCDCNGCNCNDIDCNDVDCTDCDISCLI